MKEVPRLNRASLGTPIGRLVIYAGEGGVVAIKHESGRGVDRPVRRPYVLDPKVGGELLKEAMRQLREYFEGELRAFDLPLDPRGTDFQLRIWRAVMRIPYGSVKSYGEVARDVGSPRAARAVGNAMRANPLMIIVPCHRVVASGGGIGGYSLGVGIKKYLLELERAHL